MKNLPLVVAGLTSMRGLERLSGLLTLDLSGNEISEPDVWLGKLQKFTLNGNPLGGILWAAKSRYPMLSDVQFNNSVFPKSFDWRSLRREGLSLVGVNFEVSQTTIEGMDAEQSARRISMYIKEIRQANSTKLIFKL